MRILMSKVFKLHEAAKIIRKNSPIHDNIEEVLTMK